MVNYSSRARIRRLAGALGAAAGTLALATACVGGSTANSASGPTTGTAGSTASGQATGTGAGATGSIGGTSGGSGGTAGGQSTVQASPTSSRGSSGGSTGGSTGNSDNTSSTCSPRYLAVSISSQGGAAAGTDYITLVFHNLLPNQSCTLYGYPGVSFGHGTPVTQVGAPADKDNAVAKTVVTLPPLGYAHAVLGVADAGNYPASTCQPVQTTWLQVYAPNTTNLLYTPYDSEGCANTGVVTLHVRAVQSGSS